MDVAVDDATADAAMAAYGDVREEDRIVNFAIRVHAHVGRKNGIPDQAAGDNASVRYDGIKCGAHTIFFGENKFRRGILPLVRADRPLVIVKIEDGRDRD